MNESTPTSTTGMAPETGVDTSDPAHLDVLFARGVIGLVIIDLDGDVMGLRGQLLPEISVGDNVYDMVPMLEAYADAAEEIANGTRDELTVPNVNLTRGDGADAIVTLRVVAMPSRDSVALVLQERSDMARLEQEVMQQRNELTIARQKLAAQNEELQRANEELDRAHRLLQERFESQKEELDTKAQRLVDEVALRQDVEERFWQIFHYDPVTNLPNRRMFLDRLEGRLAAMRDADVLTVMLINLDEFRLVNEMLGRNEGDDLLRDVAERLKTLRPRPELISHFGGDEFGLIISYPTDVSAISGVAQRLNGLLNFTRGDAHQEVTISSRIGIAIRPNDGVVAGDLLRNAEVALGGAKETGGSGFAFFHDAMNQRVRAKREMTAALRKALREETLILHYQPQLDLKTNKIIGAESLCRWTDPTLGPISPGTFIPLAEESGLIGDLGLWALREICRQKQEWNKAGLPNLKLAVNLAASEFGDPQIVDTVQRTLDAYDIDPETLEIEITETVAMDDPELTTPTIARLMGLGVRLAIDDFGTGYSSLAYLKSIPVHKIKIDQGFVRDISPGGDPGSIAQAVIRLSHGFGMRVIAEGVETEFQKQFMADSGCDEIQGYLLSRPLPPDEFVAFLKNRPDLA